MSTSSVNVTPPNEELNSKNLTFNENTQKPTENPAKTTEVLPTHSESPSIPIKVIVSPSKKFQSSSSSVQPQFKNITQPFATPMQQPTQMVNCYFICNLVVI